MLSASLLCLANISIRSLSVPILAVTVFGSSRVLCDAKKDMNDWLADLSKKGKDAIESKSFEYRSFIPDSAADIFKPEKIGQVSYGFAAGFLSGYCIKKVAKAAAFAVGGLFIIVQTLAYNGYLTVNQDRIKKEFEVTFYLMSVYIFL